MSPTHSPLPSQGTSEQGRGMTTGGPVLGRGTQKKPSTFSESQTSQATSSSSNTLQTPSSQPGNSSKHVQFDLEPSVHITTIQDHPDTTPTSTEHPDTTRQTREHYFGILKAKVPRNVPKSSKLKVAVLATFADGSTKTVQALIDTGAEVSLINPRLVDSALFQPSPKPVRLGVANSHRLPGGKRQTVMVLTFEAAGRDTKQKCNISLPCSAYDAEVVCDMILSYKWMAENNVVPHPRTHGIIIQEEDDQYWVPGIITPKSHNITVLEGLPIQIMPGAVTPPASPTTTTQAEFICHQVSSHWEAFEDTSTIVSHIRQWNLHTTPQHPGMGCPDIPGLAEEGQPDSLLEEDLHTIASEIQHLSADVNYIKGFVQSGEPIQGPQVETLRSQILSDYASTVFLGRTSGNPPKRGPLGEAEIILKPDVVPTKQRPFQMVGERRAAWVKLTDQLIQDGKIEPGQSPWCSPSFPVPKKKPGEYRLVVDFRRLNDATIVDSHPLPRIGDILQRQGKFQIWSVMDMKDGYHQIPLKEAHRHLTCMSTPRGVMQWKVLVMGLKNGNAIFQRVMEDVLKDFDYADAYVDDIIIGSTATTQESLLEVHDKDLRKVLDALREVTLIADPKKCKFFVREVQFCGHVLREGQRYPAPGKLMPIQKWEVPATLTKLRGFLGLCNYYEEYVPGYAQLAWKIMEKLKVNGVKSKAGSNLPLKWTEDEKQAFEDLKKALAASLSLHQLEPDKPFQMRTDASHTAIGAVLEQTKRQTHWVPICFFSRKLTISQVNWSPREKEAYGIVASLVKWAGWIGTTTVTVVTDHKSLESWVREYVDTPSGPTGRRARWHELFSQFQLSIQYQPGHTNIPADAMTRYAYPASNERQDVSMHGSVTSATQVKQMAKEEEEAEKSMPDPTSTLCQFCKRDLFSTGIFMLTKTKSRENYRLTTLVRDKALWDIGVAKEHITVDLFASNVNASCPLYITKRMDAFTYHWPSLCVKPTDILWANPPFSMMEEVVTKLILEPCKVVLVAPEFKQASWWKPLDMITVARVYLPAHQGVYVGDCQHTILPPPEWRTSISLVDTIKWTSRPIRPQLVSWVQRTSQHKGMEHLQNDIPSSRHIAVTTRSGKITEEDDPETSQEGYSSDSSQSLHSAPPQGHQSSEIPQPPPPEIHQTPIDTPPTEQQGFRFFHQMSPSEQAARRLQRTHKGHRRTPSPHVELQPPPLVDSTPVLSESWADKYATSQEFSGMWEDTQNPSVNWPHGVQLHQGRMYFQGKLCVPELLVHRVLWEFHIASGHIGIKRMTNEVNYRFLFPSAQNIPTLIKQIRQSCTICQAADPPQHPKLGIQQHFPVPERCMHSVCLDIFSMPHTIWESQPFDCILLCVDRLSGWIVAAPTLKDGLTAEKAAHLILEKGWEPFGIPTTVHSDQGPQFTGQWWRTMCARLGIQQTFSQPHRPRANGRAERAGRQLLSVLQKLHMELSLNWVQALPRALKIYHDVAGPTGLSPYHILFGRDRLVQGIPYQPERVCEDAQDFMTRMEILDKQVAAALEKIHQHRTTVVNTHLPTKDDLPTGSLVWVLKAPDLASQTKIEAKWRGPFVLKARIGNRSYVVADRRGTTFSVHLDQIKPYTALGEPGELAGLEGWDRKLDKIVACQESADGDLQYNILWVGSKEPQWVSHTTLMAMGWQGKVEEFHKTQTQLQK